jgi:hypothetical protein
VHAFKLLYELFRGGNLPAAAVMMDALTTIPQQERQRCVDMQPFRIRRLGRPLRNPVRVDASEQPLVEVGRV